jgi:hypothetical protein
MHSVTAKRERIPRALQVRRGAAHHTISRIGPLSGPDMRRTCGPGPCAHA